MGGDGTRGSGPGQEATFIMFAISLMMLFGFAFGPLHAMIKGDL